MDRCIGCGGQLTTGGCINPNCGMSLGGTYINGRKVVPAPAAASEWQRGYDAGYQAGLAASLTGVQIVMQSTIPT